MDNNKEEVKLVAQSIVDDFKLAMIKEEAYQNANLLGLDDELQAYLNARDVVSSGEEAVVIFRQLVKRRHVEQAVIEELVERFEFNLAKSERLSRQ